MIKSYRDLRVWQASMDLVEGAYRLTAEMPSSETFGLISQIRRSAVSVPANIAEGYGRDSTGSYIHYLRTARGSLRELETHVLIGQRVGLLAITPSDRYLNQAEDIGKMLGALIRSIESTRRTQMTGGDI